MKQAASPKPEANGGFSLVEVTLALGIIAVSLVSLIGMLPAGLGSLRASMDATVHAQILQRVASEIVTSPFEALGDRDFGFDADGRLVNGSDASLFYRVEVRGLDPSLPGVSSDSDVQEFRDHLKRMAVSISRASDPSAPAARYALQIAAN
jgi:uncharacterized protein (TIGR02598 family)